MTTKSMDELMLERQHRCWDDRDAVCPTPQQCNMGGCARARAKLPEALPKRETERGRRLDLVAIERVTDALPDLDKPTQTRVLIAAAMLYAIRLEEI